MKDMIRFVSRMIVLPFSFFISTSQAQTISEVFKAMPDSLTPYLTTNNRLDLLDFMEAKMKAVVNNELGGETEMTFLSDDSLCVKMNDALTFELKLEKSVSNTQSQVLDSADSADSIVICLKKTYKTSGHQKEVITQRFSSSWCPVSKPSVTSTLLRRDDEVFDKTI